MTEPAWGREGGGRRDGRHVEIVPRLTVMTSVSCNGPCLLTHGKRCDERVADGLLSAPDASLPNASAGAQDEDRRVSSRLGTQRLSRKPKCSRRNGPNDDIQSSSHAFTDPTLRSDIAQSSSTKVALLAVNVLLQGLRWWFPGGEAFFGVFAPPVLFELSWLWSSCSMSLYAFLLSSLIASSCK